MTHTDASSSDVCPICGSTLMARDASLYCANCDLLYEDDDHVGRG